MLLIVLILGFGIGLRRHLGCRLLGCFLFCFWQLTQQRDQIILCILLCVFNCAEGCDVSNIIMLGILISIIHVDNVSTDHIDSALPVKIIGQVKNTHTPALAKVVFSDINLLAAIRLSAENIACAVINFAGFRIAILGQHGNHGEIRCFIRYGDLGRKDDVSRFCKRGCSDRTVIIDGKVNVRALELVKLFHCGIPDQRGLPCGYA